MNKWLQILKCHKWRVMENFDYVINVDIKKIIQ